MTGSRSAFPLGRSIVASPPMSLTLPSSISGRSVAALMLGAITALGLPGPLSADAPPRQRASFYGTWASDAHCRWSEVFMLIYDRGYAEMPHRHLTAPGLACRTISVSGKGPEWKLRLSCLVRERPGLEKRRFEVRQRLTQSADGYKMLVETDPFHDYPARSDDARYCRGANEPQPPLICFDAEKGHSYPCEP